MITQPETDIRTVLAPIVPQFADPRAGLSEEAVRRLLDHWATLEHMGFELELRRDSLRVQHRNRGFETVIQLSHEDDLGERRALYRDLRDSFGRVTDRLFSWLFQPSPSVMRPYESLREIVALCQRVRQSQRMSA